LEFSFSSSSSLVIIFIPYLKFLTPNSPITVSGVTLSSS
jgi:hypothetical protein